jgi:hypothetical protein
MKKILLILCIPFYLFSIDNPYTSLDNDEKLNVMINHFLTLSLEKSKPPFPQKSELKDDGATLDPVKYELYFSYIQRLKAIRESRAEEQIIIDEDYIGKIGFYNGKLKSLKKFYNKNENLYPLLETSINKAFKIVFGKPSFSNIMYDDDINLLRGNLNTIDLYKVSSFIPKELEFFVYKGNRDDFIKNYKYSDIKVRFTYDGKYLIYKDVLFSFKNNEYLAKFINPTNHKIKLDIKINDDIFQAIKIGDIK